MNHYNLDLPKRFKNYQKFINAINAAKGNQDESNMMVTVVTYRGFRFPEKPTLHQQLAIMDPMMNLVEQTLRDEFPNYCIERYNFSIHVIRKEIDIDFNLRVEFDANRWQCIAGVAYVSPSVNAKFPKFIDQDALIVNINQNIRAYTKIAIVMGQMRKMKETLHNGYPNCIIEKNNFSIHVRKEEINFTLRIDFDPNVKIDDNVEIDKWTYLVGITYVSTNPKATFPQFTNIDNVLAQVCAQVPHDNLPRLRRSSDRINQF